MPTSVNISSYSGSVSGNDWSPAVMAALGAIKTTGGTINIDRDIRVESQISPASVSGWVEYCPVTFQGLGGAITVAAPLATPFYMNGNCLNVVFRNITFIGAADETTVSCTRLILGLALQYTLIDGCTFYGIKSTTNGVIYSWNNPGNLIMQNSVFGGCSSGGAFVLAENSETLSMKNVAFYDYGSCRNVSYGSPQVGGGTHWVKHTYSGTPTTSHVPLTELDTVRSDEGYNFLYIDGVPRVQINNCASNLLLGASNSGIYLKNVDNAEIRRYWAGYASNGNAIGLENCGKIIIDGLQTDNGTHPISIDGLTDYVAINNSPDASITITGTPTYSVDGAVYKYGWSRPVATAN